MNSTAGNCSLSSGVLPLLVLAVVLPLALAAGIYRQRRETRRLSGLAAHLDATVKTGKIVGKHNGLPYEILYYTGKHHNLWQVQVGVPFQGYPFKIRKENYGDEILKQLSRKFEDLQTGDPDFDKRFRVGVSPKYTEWMKEYTGVPGRLDALQWFFQNGYGSVHSDGGKLVASYTETLGKTLEKESHPVWDPLFIRQTLNALDHAAKLEKPVVYESWEEWRRRILTSGFRLEGQHFTILAILAAVLAAMAIYLITALRDSGPTV